MLELKHVSKIYGQGDVKVSALDDISLTIEKGDFVAVMGPSGSGKSTLLNVIGGLDSVSSGEVSIDGERIDNRSEDAMVEARRGKIAYVFQQYHLLRSLSALENVLLPLTFQHKGLDNGHMEKARGLLKMVGLEKRADHDPGQLSGGEQQRVAIARALVSNPELILADEPTGNMDRKTGNEILRLFDMLNREGHTIVMVTHDPDVARRAKAIISLQDGRIVGRTENTQA